MLKRYAEKPPVLDEQSELQSVRDRFQKCSHAFRIARRTIANGAIIYVEQCQICGGNGKTLKSNSLSDKDKSFAVCYSESKSSEYWRGIHEKERQALVSLRQSAEKQWWAWYNRYLQSDVWKERRRLVFARSGGLCEACGTEKATQVHHKTYEHVGFEPLFDLVAVCAPCHDIITQSDREESDRLPKEDDAFDFVV